MDEKDARLNRMATLKERFRSVTRVLVASYLGLCLFLFLAQDRLLFHQPRLKPTEAAQLLRDYDDLKEERLAVAEHVTLHGWLTPGPFEHKQPLIIFFGGNGEEVSHFAWDHEQLPGWAMVFFNYRGYGLSGGRPSEAALYHDALAIYDAYAKRPEVDQQRIVVMGRSLGSGVAVYLAQHRPVAGVILITPYDSITRVAQGYMPFVPVSLFLRHHFNSIGRAPSMTMPMLALTAEKDITIPPVHAQRLAAKWKGAVTLVQIPKAGHNNLENNEHFWVSIRDFLTRH